MFQDWLVLVSTSCALALVVGAGAAGSTNPSSVTAQGCHEIAVFIDVPEEAEPLVRSRVPGRFDLYRTEYGAAQLALISRRCTHVAVAAGEARTMVEARFAVVVAAPPGSSATCPVCNWYLLFWASDNQHFNAWLKEGTGLAEEKIRYVSDLAYAYAPASFPSENFESSAPKPTPSPFDVVARAADPNLEPAGIPFVAHVWALGETRTVKFTAELDAIRFASAVGTVSAEPGTEMHAMFGAASRSFQAPAASNAWDGEWTKELCDADWVCTRR